MSARELDAAGIFDPNLRASYLECKRLNSLHGKTYYLATLLLPPGKRPFVHALYGFARYADEIVDDLSSTLPLEEKAEVLRRWSDQLLDDLAKGASLDHIGAALVDTVHRFEIPLEHFRAFLPSMAMDISVTRYENYSALMEYVYGSAAVIGLEMVPILGPLADEAYPAAEKLGIAFQLANFIRDVDIRCKLNNRVDGDHPRRNNIIRNEFAKAGATIIYEDGDLDIPIALEFKDEALGTWFLMKWT